jgi:signal transduction histidine kinase
VNRTALGNAPAEFRGPFARWPRAADAVLALVVLVAMVFVKDAPGDELAARPIGDVPIIVLLGFAASAAALYWRRPAPLVAVAVALVAWATELVGADKNMSGIVAIIALYSTGRYAARDRRSQIAAAAGIAGGGAMVTIDYLVDSPPWQEDAALGSVAFGCVVMFAAWSIGRLVRLRAEHAAQRMHAQAAEAGRIVVEERTRIARELHDVVAHRVSLMTVQAGAAKAVAAEDLDAALQAMGAVEEAGRQALGELRHLLGVLRPEADLDGLGPQPGLADLPRLVEQICAAGVAVSLTKDEVPVELPARVDLFAYRIIQEALTNVLKHAGPGARTDVRLGTDNGGVVIEVVNDSPDGPHGSPAVVGGHGIIGMRERALLLGGTLDAGPRPGGGFRVVAHLPTGGEPA